MNLVRLALLAALASSTCTRVSAQDAPQVLEAPVIPPESIATLQSAHEKIPAFELPATKYLPPADAIWAAPEGDAKVDGRDKARPTSLENALFNSPANSTVVLRGGTYRGLERDALPRALTIQAAPDEKPWISGSEVVAQWEKEGARWRAKWEMSWKEALGGVFIDKKFPLAGRPEMAFVNGRPLVQVARVEDVVAGTFCVDGASKYLWIGDDPSGKLVEATAHRQAFRARNAGLYLRGVGFKHYAESPFRVWRSRGAPKVSIEDCVFAWNAAQGMKCWGEPRVERPARDVEIRRCGFYANGLVGLEAQRPSGFWIEGCRFAWNNVEKFSKSWAAAGAKLIMSRATIVRDSVFEDNEGAGLWLDVSVVEAQVVNNTSRRNRGAGIFVELSHRCIVAFNTIEDCSPAGIELSNSSEVQVWNNTVRRCGRADGKGASGGIVVKDDARENVRGKGRESGFDEEGAERGAMWVASGNVVCNNVMMQSTPALNVAYTQEGRTSSQHVAHVDGNYYEVPAGQGLVRWNFEPSLASPIREFNFLSEFRAATEFEKSGVQGPRTAIVTTTTQQGIGSIITSGPVRYLTEYKPVALPPEIQALRPGTLVSAGASQYIYIRVGADLGF